MLINAGASAPSACWIDGLAPGGRLVVPLVRWPHRAEQSFGGGTGVVVLVTRGQHAYGARVLGSVVIFPCIGGVDAGADDRLADAMRRLDEAEAVRSLRRDRHDQEPSCWLHGEGYCLSPRPTGEEISV
jgi:protein-L-isoaspartate(D-aspartate) O-methyltransferase